MSGMILCRTKKADSPFFCRHMGIRLFSLEELCYYLYNNIYIINDDFFDEALLSFIEEQTEEKPLADRLRFMKGQGAGLAELIVTVLKYVDYYSVDEIEQLKGVLEVLNTQNVYERLKTRGDGYLLNKRYYSAIINYMQIIEGRPDNSLSGLFYAKVYHNTGVAFARMFRMQDAKQYFEAAYKIGQHEESKKCADACDKLAADEGVIENDDATGDEWLLRKELEKHLDNARYCDEYRELAGVEKLKEEGKRQEYNRVLADMTENFKNQYIRYIS